MNVGFWNTVQLWFTTKCRKSYLIFFLCKSDQIPILNLGPLTGVIQPIIGAMSDKTWHPRWGRRKALLFLLIDNL
jgi:maltose/moltooligosaccharide transporter